MAWRLAKSLVTLRGEIWEEWPGTTIWTIGDPAHAARCSRHNPNDEGVVCAIDVCRQPGFDIHAFADRLVVSPHPELDYVISRRRVASRRTNWRWHRYLGSNPHDTHIHVAVGDGTDCESRQPYDSTQSWGVTQVPSTPSPPPPISQETEDMSVAIIKGNSKPEWFLWDLGRNTKRWIENRQEALYLAQCGAKAEEYEGLKVVPFPIDQGFVDGIPKE